MVHLILVTLVSTNQAEIVIFVPQATPVQVVTEARLQLAHLTMLLKAVSNQASHNRVTNGIPQVTPQSNAPTRVTGGAKVEGNVTRAEPVMLAQILNQQLSSIAPPVSTPQLQVLANVSPAQLVTTAPNLVAYTKQCMSAPLANTVWVTQLYAHHAQPVTIALPHTQRPLSANVVPQQQQVLTMSVL